MMTEDAGAETRGELLTDSRLRLRIQCEYADGADLLTIAAERRLTVWQVAEACFGTDVCKPRREHLRWEQLGGPGYERKTTYEVGQEQRGEKMKARRVERERVIELDRPKGPATWAVIYKLHCDGFKQYEIADHLGVSTATIRIAVRWFSGRTNDNPHPMKDKILRLYGEGCSLQGIQARIGCSWITALFIARDAGILRDEDIPAIARNANE